MHSNALGREVIVAVALGVVGLGGGGGDGSTPSMLTPHTGAASPATGRFPG